MKCVSIIGQSLVISATRDIWEEVSVKRYKTQLTFKVNFCHAFSRKILYSVEVFVSRLWNDLCFKSSLIFVGHWLGIWCGSSSWSAWVSDRCGGCWNCGGWWLAVGRIAGLRKRERQRGRERQWDQEGESMKKTKTKKE